ncbi:MAG: response regulator [Planctomycetota bacterium]|nr:response regulator [Planctomycetota bacterium]
MNNPPATFANPFHEALTALSDAFQNPQRLKECAICLNTACDAIHDVANERIYRSANLIRQYVGAAAELILSDTSTDPSIHSLLTPLKSAVESLLAEVDGDPVDGTQLDTILQELAADWGDCLGVIEFGELDPVRFSADHNIITDRDSFDTEQLSQPTETEIQRLLSALGTAANATASLPLPNDAAFDSLTASLPDAAEPTDRSLPNAGTIDDAEMRTAYLDDAQRCLASMEKSVLLLEEVPQQREPLRQICRELHTLKGASGTVGLHQLAEQLHHVEDSLQACCQTTDRLPNIDDILQCVDLVRLQIQALQFSAHSPAPDSAGDTAVDQPKYVATAIDEVTDGETIRVKASRIDRLMDMLAELIMLRNQRESRVADQEQLRGEMVRCVSRLRLIHDRLRQSVPQNRNPSTEANLAPWESLSGDSLSEVANDVLAVSRRMQELTTPVAEENHTVSRLVRQFRHELVELRRMPVAGLFRKLQRVVRDAGRAEQKKVRLTMEGEHAGMERTLQERLYEPLLHIVRNAVSHGIESESDRLAVGKEGTGTIRLSAQGSPNLLVITVRDDGRGLDYDSLRRRGLELGLLAPDRSPSHDELAQLIFHPGFSTRKSVTSISGRGVGMDVVADTLQRLGAWIEIESHAGQGTAMRLHIPLRSVIEHTMVFRSGGQLFAVPMQYVKYSGESVGEYHDTPQPTGTQPPLTIPFHTLFDTCVQVSANEGTLLILGDGANLGMENNPTSVRRIGFFVDAIVGPEEIVVRTLPNLLQKQMLFSGVTLAGSGETMLMLDGSRLLDYAQSKHAQQPQANSLPTVAAQPCRLPILIVDDSFSIRRDMVRMLQSLGHRVVEAGDGVEARQLLRQQEFSLVISDLEMPRMDGFDLLQDMKHDPSTNRVPVVIASSRNEPTCRDKAMLLGAEEFLIKPVNQQQLRTTIRTLLHKKSPPIPPSHGFDLVSVFTNEGIQ